MIVQDVQLRSVITCPHCGHQCEEEMPLGACRYFYQCKNCGSMLKPNRGDCCVFCSFGSVRCPSKQMELNV